MSSRPQWFGVRKELPPRRGKLLFTLAFVLPLLAWSIVSYVPFVWHPLVEVTEPAGASFFQRGMLVEKAVFEAENHKLAAARRPLARGITI